jgi:predicted ester cyclase
MSTSRAKELANQWFQRVWQQKSREAIFELMSPEASGYAEGGLRIDGPEQFAEMRDQFFAAFPDLALEILHSVGDDREACVHWKLCGTQAGDFASIPATHSPVSFTGMTYLVFEKDRIIQGWDCWDQGKVIGALAATASGAGGVA